jgi:hypothetical protein
MDDPASQENPPADFNKLDLSHLQSFSFGTQWTQDKSAPDGAGRSPREGRREERPVRPREGGRPPGEAPGAEPRRDRRGFRRPDGPAGPGAPGSAPREGGGGMAPPPRGEERGGGARGPRHEGDGRRGGFNEAGPDRGPYFSPWFSVTFYPEEGNFATLARTIRASNRTFELFEIARAVVGKSDRCIALVQRTPPAGEAPAGAASVRPAPLAVAVPDGAPCESEEAAIAHVLATHLDKFFATTAVEIEPPKGNFQVINRCGVTGALLGPPNYHRYLQIVQQHHAARVRLPFETYRSRIESVRDPEIVNQWLAQMRRVTRYVWKLAGENETPPAFDTLEEARLHLLTHARDQVVRTAESVRVPGKNVATLPPGEIRRAIEGALERQRRFPLETANALRGRLRREGFTIFKKGSKGISYVCAVRRKFRVPGQVFADHIGALISFIEGHPMVKVGDLAEKFLGLAPALPPAAPPPAAESSGAPEGAAAPPPPAPALPSDDQMRLARLHGDVRWLVSEGYVLEFMDGRLFATPPVAESRQQEAETAEHDPENFPESPPPAVVPGAQVEPAAPKEAPVESTVHAEAPPDPSVRDEALPASPLETSASGAPAPEVAADLPAPIEPAPTSE